MLHVIIINYVCVCMCVFVRFFIHWIHWNEKRGREEVGGFVGILMAMVSLQLSVEFQRAMFLRC